MKKKIIIGLCFLIMATVSYAQKKKKPNVLVYGSDIIAFSAALQSAKSDVPTLWVVSQPEAMGGLLAQPTQVDNTYTIDGGIWLDILMDMAISKVKDDSLAAVVKRDIQPELFSNVVKKALDSQPNLTVIYDTKVKALKQNKKDWTVLLDDKKRLNVRAIVDASKEQGLRVSFLKNTTDRVIQPLKPVADLTAEQIRTLVASGQLNKTLYGVQLSDILNGEHAGFIDLLGVSEVLNSDKNNLPLASAIGQAIGATAAYMAFFKTTADKIDVRKLQTELLTYGMRIVPYQDLRINDVNFLAIQKVGLVAILSQEEGEKEFMLARDQYVSLEEVKPVFDELYTRAQLWFLDHKGEYFKWKDFLSLVQFVGLKGDEVKDQVEKEWSTKLNFQGDFDENALVTRYQFAVILDRYAGPYSKAVNTTGNFKN